MNRDCLHFGLWAALLGLFLAGCGTDSRVRVRSVERSVVDAPVLPTAVYWSADTSTADIYLTDLDLTMLDIGTPLTELRGRIVHLHLFLVPLAGSTPIGNTSCSVTIRHVVLTGGEIGVYSGGGFLVPRSRGRNDLSGSMREATLRLTSKTAGFSDQLGPSVMDLSFLATRAEAQAKRIGMRVGEVLMMSEPVNSTTRGEGQGDRTIRPAR